MISASLTGYMRKPYSLKFSGTSEKFSCSGHKIGSIASESLVFDRPEFSDSIISSRKTSISSVDYFFSGLIAIGQLFDSG
jgi:hypothetical protein